MTCGGTRRIWSCGCPGVSTPLVRWLSRRKRPQIPGVFRLLRLLAGGGLAAGDSREGRGTRYRHTVQRGDADRFPRPRRQPLQGALDDEADVVQFFLGDPQS